MKLASVHNGGAKIHNQKPAKFSTHKSHTRNLQSQNQQNTQSFTTNHYSFESPQTVTLQLDLQPNKFLNTELFKDTKLVKQNPDQQQSKHPKSNTQQHIEPTEPPKQITKSTTTRIRYGNYTSRAKSK